MKVLIIGSRGQLGTDLIDAFSDCPMTPYTSEDMDITDEALVQQQIAFTAPDLLINAAAFTRVDECEHEILKAYSVNAAGPRNLALACKRWDIPLAHISTNYIFDGEKDGFYNEDDPARPVNSYGVSKLAGEHFIRHFWEKHYIFRVSGLFGLTPSRMKGTNFVEAMLRLGSKGTPLRIVSDESLSPTFTEDASKIVRQAVETKEYGIYHLTNRGGCTWFDFAQEIFSLAGMNVKLEPVTAEEYGAPAKRPKNSCLENGRLKQIGIDTARLWQEALNDYLEKRDA